MAGGAALAAAGIAFVALRAWRLDIGIPISYRGDALLNLGWVQNVVETGWYLEAPRLGAPFGQEHHDYPLGPDQLHFVLLRVLALITGQAPASVNLFYLLTFPLAAVTCFWAMRRLGVAGPVAAFGGVVFAILPYHFIRGEGHLFLSAYETVPLAGYLIVATAQGAAFFALGRRGSQSDGRRSRAVAIAGAAVLALLVASGGAYYAAFTLVLIAAATVLGTLRRRSRRVLVSGSLLLALVLAFVGLNSLPSVLYRLENGSNPDVPVRDEIETERHGLRPVTLLLPIVDHRLQPLDELASRYAVFPTSGERGEALGVVGAAGLVLLLVVGLASLAGGFARRRRWSRHRVLAALVLVALLFGIIGGGSSLMAVLLTAQIRAWARLSIFIAFFSLLAICIAVTWSWRRARTRRARAILATGLAVLLAVAALDQTSNRFVPAYRTLAAQFAADRDFFGSLEAMLPAGAAVYQLPYRQYPEGGQLEETPDYEPMRGYLHSRTLRWSYGGIKGREAGWQLYVYSSPLGEVMPLVAGAGFAAVMVDRDAYADSGRGTEATLAGLLGAAAFQSADGRYAVYDVRPYASALEERYGVADWARMQDLLLQPVWPRWGAGVKRGFAEAGVVSRAAGARASLDLVNEGEPGREVVVSFGVATRSGEQATVEVRWPDGTVESHTTSSVPASVERTIVLRPGANRIELSTDAGDLAATTGAEPLRMRLTDFWVLDSALASFVQTATQPAPPAR